jgi:hypothetical protein
MLLASSTAGTQVGNLPLERTAPVGLTTAVHPGVATIPHGNLSIPLFLPSLTLAAGTHLVARYQFKVVSWPTGLPNLTVWVYSELAVFRESSGASLEETIGARNQTVVNGTLSNPNATTGNVTIGAAGASFSNGSKAVLSSQLLAVMVSVPWGTLTMDFRWDWESITPSGVANYSSWSTFQTITPPEHLTVVSDGPPQLTPGAAFQVCIAGPVQNRTFSLHMEVPSPYVSFAWNTTHVPGNWTGTYCWSDTMPSTFTKLPSMLLVHIWEYNTLPSILYILHTEGITKNSGTVTGDISPTGANAHLGSTHLTLTAGLFRVVMTPGTYWLGANASGYGAGGYPVTVVANATTWANLSLAADKGILVGTIVPALAQVSVDGAALQVNSSGGNFSSTLSPGRHSVHAQAAGYASNNSNVNVVVNSTTTIALVLLHYTGWLTGNVTPSSASLAVDGTNVPVGPQGSFNASVATGRQTLSASLQGYSLWEENITIYRNTTTHVSIKLAPGWVAGKVVPFYAFLSLNGVQVEESPQTGAFNVSVLGGTIWAEALASGYLPFNENFTAVAGKTFSLMPVLDDTAVLEGFVHPVNATLHWEDTPVSVGPAGNWSVTTTSGSHWLNASAKGFTSQALQVTLPPGRTAWGNVTLVLVTGQIQGTVTPAGANLSLDGSPVPLNAQGGFSLPEVPGTYSLTASALDHSPLERSITIISGEVKWANLSLRWTVGWVTGTILPSNGSLLEGQIAVVPLAGAFNVTQSPGTYVWLAQAWGFVARNGSTVVTSGVVTDLQVVLKEIPGFWPPPVVSPPAPVATNPPISTPGADHSAGYLLGSAPILSVLVGTLILGVGLVAWMATRKRTRPPPSARIS